MAPPKIKNVSIPQLQLDDVNSPRNTFSRIPPPNFYSTRANSEIRGAGFVPWSGDGNWVDEKSLPPGNVCGYVSKEWIAHRKGKTANKTGTRSMSCTAMKVPAKQAVCVVHTPRAGKNQLDAENPTKHTQTDIEQAKQAAGGTPLKGVLKYMQKSRDGHMWRRPMQHFRPHHTHSQILDTGMQTDEHSPLPLSLEQTDYFCLLDYSPDEEYPTAPLPSEAPARGTALSPGQSALPKYRKTTRKQRSTRTIEQEPINHNTGMRLSSLYYILIMVMLMLLLTIIVGLFIHATMLEDLLITIKNGPEPVKIPATNRLLKWLSLMLTW